MRETIFEIEDAPDASEIESPDSFDDELAFSWKTESGTTAIKKTDRQVFLYRVTVIPREIRDFFSVEDLTAGEKRRIKLWYRNHPFDAFIEKTVHPTPRTRMIWKPDFAAVLRMAFPGWLDFFRKTRKDAVDTPSIRFEKRQQPGQYDVEFEGPEGDDFSPRASSAHTSVAPESPEPAHARPEDAAPEFHVPIKSGEVIDNDTLTAIFLCSPGGEMRRSLRTNSLVLISDHTRSVYEDTWTGKIFHYTGVGLTGKQSLSSQNKTLAESGQNGVGLYLFEVFEEGNYVYVGEVELAAGPYLSRQPDSEKNLRDVYIFPLKRKVRSHSPAVKKELPEMKEESTRTVRQQPIGEPGLPSKNVHPDSGKHGVISSTLDREQEVSEYARQRAKGICQLCDKPAPFRNPDGEPFLETHHIDPLADGGQDITENTVALCPNCHRKMHALKLPADVAVLRKKVS